MTGDHSEPLRPCSRCGGTGVEIDDQATGSKLRADRQRLAGLTLREVARRMGLSAAYLSDLELGRRRWNAGLIERYREAAR